MCFFLSIYVALSLLFSKSISTHGADSLLDGRQVDLLPQVSVGVTLVDVVGVDLGAAAVFGTLPGDGHGGAVTAQHGDAEGSAGSGWEEPETPINFTSFIIGLENKSEVDY